MQKEIEATFINIDKDALRAKLKQLGATMIQPEINMKRVIFELPGAAFARVRNEGNKIVMTYKRIHENTLTGTEEVNVEIDDYDAGVNFLKGIGLEAKAYQETLREEWKLDNVDIDIDTWPWLPPYVEIEGPSPQAVEDVATKLGFSLKNAHYGSVDEIYKLYYDVSSHDINYCPEITFTDVPEWLESKRRAVPPEK